MIQKKEKNMILDIDKLINDFGEVSLSLLDLRNTLKKISIENETNMQALVDLLEAEKENNKILAKELQNGIKLDESKSAILMSALYQIIFLENTKPIGECKRIAYNAIREYSEDINDRAN